MGCTDHLTSSISLKVAYNLCVVTILYGMKLLKLFQMFITHIYRTQVLICLKLKANFDCWIQNVSNRYRMHSLE